MANIEIATQTAAVMPTAISTERVLW